MTKLTNIQAGLLTCATERSDGSMLPLPDGLGPLSPGLRKSISALINGGLAQEVAVADPRQSWRKDGEQLSGVAITAGGRAAVASNTAPTAPESTLPPAPSVAADAPEPLGRQTKSALVLSLLQRDDGATLSELVEATGWLPHTTRAALTGLRKKGHGITKSKRGEATCYRVPVAV